jgi:hypothetical protein
MPKLSAAKSGQTKPVAAKASAQPVSAARASTPRASAAKTPAPKLNTGKTAAHAALPKVVAAKSVKRGAALAAAPAKAKAPAPPVATKTVATKTVAKAVPAKTVVAKAVVAKSAATKAVLDTPAKLRPIEQAVGVSSDAVARRTGKSWAEWFALLDAAGAAELDHKGIVAVLAQRHGVGPWWQQMVTVAYEKARGMREHHENDDGFQAGVSKTLELPLAKLFRFWAEPAERNKWLADDRFSIHKATASKSIRARWGRGVSRIDVDFCEKGPTKSQVTVQHNRIETSDAAEQMKAYWAKKISALEALLTRA